MKNRAFDQLFQEIVPSGTSTYTNRILEQFQETKRCFTVLFEEAREANRIPAGPSGYRNLKTGILRTVLVQNGSKCKVCPQSRKRSLRTDFVDRH
jgi:hypothetical protein